MHYRLTSTDLFALNSRLPMSHMRIADSRHSSEISRQRDMACYTRAILAYCIQG